MGFFSLLITSIGLSMDAFACALCLGLKMDKNWSGKAFIVALFFGGFQAVMPLLGWVLGNQFEAYIVNIDHWVAFILLAIIGGKMVYDGLKGEMDTQIDSINDNGFSIKELFVLSIATSIDALAIGITFSFLHVDILSSIFIIGITTFTISFLGVFLGTKFGTLLQSKAEIAGGIILIIIGFKILLEHLAII